MNSKPKILMVNEANFLATGYSTYGIEIFKRLQKTGKYDLAELACYVTPNDARLKQTPWKVYVNYPSTPSDVEEYNSKQSYQFGEYSFEKVCLQFKPDIVFDIRDWWMMEFEERSPFRKYYKWVIMPTVDATPQHEQWLSSYMNADAVFSYSDWGVKTLEREGGGLINLQGSAPPGADINTFKPMNRKELRNKFNFEDNVNIIGTVMRNQGRKLYPELIESFVMFQKQAPVNIAEKTYLYLHVSYPDQGWDIPRLIKQCGISRKILVTYKCRECNAVFPSFFMDAVGTCTNCGRPAASMPSTQDGIDRDTLAKIINLFDCYVQYANSEGFGMPMVEAASCGVPVFAVDYSAMSDVVRKVHGYPIEVERYRVDSDVGCNRAVPNNQDLVNKWIKFFSLPEGERKRKSQQARQGVEDNYTWDKTAKNLMTFFDMLMSSSVRTESNCLNGNKKSYQNGITQNTDRYQYPSTKKQSKSIQARQTTSNTILTDAPELYGKSAKWDSPPQLHISNPLTEKHKNNEELVRWAIINVLGQPELVNSYLSLRLIRDLNWGLSMKSLGGNYANEQSILATRGNLQKFTVDDMIRELQIMCAKNNLWEQRRWQMVQDSRL